VTHRFAVNRENNGVASTITYDRPMSSIQNKPLSFMPGDEFLNRLIDFQRLVRLLHHGDLLGFPMYWWCDVESSGSLFESSDRGNFIMHYEILMVVWMGLSED
jgi:hypothetical protein